MHTTPIHSEQIGRQVVTNKGSLAHPPLILLHGWGQSSIDLRYMGELLNTSAHSHVHLIDLPGFGNSPPPPDVWSAADYSNRLLQYLDDHDIAKTDLFGHSFGGKIAIMFASSYPDRVNRLVLLNSAGLIPRRTFRLSAIKCLSFTCKLVDKAIGTHLFANYIVPRFASQDYLHAGPMRNILVRSVNEDISARAKSIQSNTLLLWGEKDRETPLEVGKRLHALIPRSRLVVFPGKGHYLHEDVGAHLCVYHMRPFLQEE